MAQIKVYGMRSTLERLLFLYIGERTGISAQDVEITRSETPRENWGIRGLPGDELGLNYKVEV